MATRRQRRRFQKLARFGVSQHRREARRPRSPRQQRQDRVHDGGIAPGAEKFETWANGLGFPNGITHAVDNAGTHLYVADFRGLHRFKLDDKTRTKIEIPNTYLGGIDGLDFHGGALIGIQNAIDRPRVIRIHLDANRLEVLEAKNRLFELPTTGAIVDSGRGGEYFFIANPGLRSFDENGQIWPMSKLREPIMVKISL